MVGSAEGSTERRAEMFRRPSDHGQRMRACARQSSHRATQLARTSGFADSSKINPIAAAKPCACTAGSRAAADFAAYPVSCARRGWMTSTTKLICARPHICGGNVFALGDRQPAYRGIAVSPPWASYTADVLPAIERDYGTPARLWKCCACTTSPATRHQGALNLSLPRPDVGHGAPDAPGGTSSVDHYTLYTQATRTKLEPRASVADTRLKSAGAR
jgi:hypothetical protein